MAEPPLSFAHSRHCTAADIAAATRRRCRRRCGRRRCPNANNNTAAAIAADILHNTNIK